MSTSIVSGPLLTLREMREALDDTTSPYYLDDSDRYAVLIGQVRTGHLIEEAMVNAHLYQHHVRTSRGVQPLAARTERGEWRWAR